MYTAGNYYEKVSTVDFSKLPEAIRKGHEFVNKATNNGGDWSNCHSSDTIKKVVDAYFEKLHKLTGRSSKSTRAAPKAKAEKTHSKPKAKPDLFQPTMVERIPDELRFIRRFVNLNGKSKTKDDILRFINSLQKAILEKKIRKASSHVEQIKFIQDTLIEAYNGMDKTITISLKPETFEVLKKAANDEKVLSSVSFIK